MAMSVVIIIVFYFLKTAGSLLNKLSEVLFSHYNCVATMLLLLTVGN